MPTLSKVEAMTPEAFITWWRGEFEQGVHVLVLGQTGAGKTVFSMWLASVRKFVLVLDGKAGDRSLEATGWQRVSKWPLPREVKERLRNNEPVRIILGIRAKTKQDMERNHALLARAVSDIWTQGRWCLVCDDLQIIADKRFAGGQIGNDIEQLLIAARDRGISVMANFQRPQIGRNTPAASAAMTQSTYVAVSMTRDRRVHERVAEIVGRPLPETEGLITSLPKYHFAVFSLDPTEPIRIVCPPRPKRATKPGEPEPQRQGKLSTWLWGHTR